MASPAENAATEAERVARGLRASREFLNSLPLNDGASRRAIDREFITVTLIPDALVALAALLAQAEAGEQAQQMFDQLEAILTPDVPEDHVVRFFQRLHGLPETGAPKHPAEARLAEAHSALREANRIALNGDEHRIPDPLGRLDAIETVTRAALTREGTE